MFGAKRSRETVQDCPICPMVFGLQWKPCHPGRLIFKSYRNKATHTYASKLEGLFSEITSADDAYFVTHNIEDVTYNVSQKSAYLESIGTSHCSSVGARDVCFDTV
jgi:hypothetical protein